MSWLRIDDGLPDHPKFIGLSNDAVALWLRCAAYASRYLTDGFIPTAVAHKLGNVVDVEWPVSELVAATLWVPCSGGWRFHDWHQWNPTKADVEERRRRDAARKRNVRSESSSDSKNVRSDKPRTRVIRQVEGRDGLRAPSSPPIQDSKESLERTGAREGAPPVHSNVAVDREHQAEMARRTLGPLREELAAKRRAKLADNADE